MGTRGALGFRVDNADKLTLNAYDSNPLGLGLDVVSFIQATEDKTLRALAPRIELVSASGTPTPEQIAHCAPWTDLSVDAQSTSSWYCLLRKAQGNLGAYAQGLRYMRDSNQFVFDSLYCEWAYVINLDTEMLEIYEGFQEKPGRGRYANGRPARGGDYYGVSLVQEIPLAAVRLLSSSAIHTVMADLESAANDDDV